VGLGLKKLTDAPATTLSRQEAAIRRDIPAIQQTRSKMNNQWRVTFYEEGDEPLVEDVNSFADAWGLAHPYPTLDGLRWKTQERANVEARFAAGENRIVVSYSSDAGTYTVIERF
jgi:hypothetical protein